MASQPLDAAQLAALAAYDTPTVCNAIELFKVRPQNAGYMDRRIAALYPELPPAVGYAATATFRSAGEPESGRSYGSLDEQIERFGELPGPAFVVFQDIDSPAAAATFGEVMCTSYKSFGAVGLITSGAGRDLLQVKPLAFPVFCDGLICSHGYPAILDVHVPVHVGGLTIRPGDLLHGDANGVTTIPAEIASEVAEACAEIVKAENILLDYCRAGSPTVAGYKEARKALGAALRATTERLRK
ncbi:MAG: RraA family protein [Acidobacteria bacterium]|nr:RraA family protein [Acidobacteriota bacterium]